MDEIEGLRGKGPFLVDVVDDEAHVRRYPVDYLAEISFASVALLPSWLNWREVNANYLCRGKLIGDCKELASRGKT